MSKIIKTNKLMFTAAIVLLLYGIIEISDCLAAVLLALKSIENPYPAFLFEPVNRAVTDSPLALGALFLFFTFFRILSALGILANRMWGFYLAVFITAATTVNLFLLLPLSAGDGLLNMAVMTLLMIGYFEKKGIK